MTLPDLTPCTFPPAACDLLATVPADRFAAFRGMTFRRGAGGGEKGHCAEEALAFLMGEPISDAPSCACPVIRAGTIRVNDSSVWEDDADRTRSLADLMLAQAGSRSTPEVEQARRFLAIRFAAKVATPFWMRRAGLESEAVTLEALVVTPETLEAVGTALRATRSATNKKYAAKIWTTILNSAPAVFVKLSLLPKPSS